MGDLNELLHEAEVTVKDHFADNPLQTDEHWITFVHERIEALCPMNIEDLLNLAEDVWHDEFELSHTCNTVGQMITGAIAARLSDQARETLREQREAVGLRQHIYDDTKLPEVLYHCAGSAGTCQQRWYARVELLITAGDNDAINVDTAPKVDGVVPVGWCPECNDWVYPVNASDI